METKHLVPVAITTTGDVGGVAELGKALGTWIRPSQEVSLAGGTQQEICKNSNYKFISRLTGDKCMKLSKNGLSSPTVWMCFFLM